VSSVTSKAASAASVTSEVASVTSEVADEGSLEESTSGGKLRYAKTRLAKKASRELLVLYR